MFSLTSTGTCALPLCTAIVRPTISGRIIERRDNVLIGRLVLLADFAGRRRAGTRHLAHWAGAKAQRGVALLTRDQLHRSAGTARELRTLARLHLDAMHGGTDRDVAQRQRIARLDRRVLAGHEL